MSSWLMPVEDDPAIAQSAAGTANAGPEAIARDKASTIRAMRRRIAAQLRRVTLTGNNGIGTFAFRDPVFLDFASTVFDWFRLNSAGLGIAVLLGKSARPAHKNRKKPQICVGGWC